MAGADFAANAVADGLFDGSLGAALRLHETKNFVLFQNVGKNFAKRFESGHGETFTFYPYLRFLIDVISVIVALVCDVIKPARVLFLDFKFFVKAGHGIFFDFGENDDSEVIPCFFEFMEGVSRFVARSVLSAYLLICLPFGGNCPYFGQMDGSVIFICSSPPWMPVDGIFGSRIDYLPSSVVTSDFGMFEFVGPKDISYGNAISCSLGRDVSRRRWWFCELPE